MSRFDISLFGFRLMARGNVGIAGALLAIAMLIGFAAISAWIGPLTD